MNSGTQNSRAGDMIGAPGVGAVIIVGEWNLGTEFGGCKVDFGLI